MKCPVQDCCVLFRTRPEIEFHLREQHSMNILWIPKFSKLGSRNYDKVQPAYCCYMCFSYCSDTQESLEHITQHDCDNKYMCLYCSKTFVDPDKLRNHTIHVHFREETSSPCPCIVEGCSFTWVRIDMFKTHMFKDHLKAVLWIGNWESTRDDLMAREQIIEVEDCMAVETTTSVESSVGIDETAAEEYSATAADNIAALAEIPEGEMQIYNFCVTKIKNEESETQPGDAYLQEFSLFEPADKILKSETQDLPTGDEYLEDFSLLDTGSNELLDTGSNELLDTGSNELLDTGSNELLDTGSNELLDTGSNELLDIGSNELLDTGSNELESEMEQLEPEDAHLQEFSALEPKSKKIKLEMQE